MFPFDLFISSEHFCPQDDPKIVAAIYASRDRKWLEYNCFRLYFTHVSVFVIVLNGVKNHFWTNVIFFSGRDYVFCCGSVLDFLIM